MNLPELFTTAPAVYAVDREYQIFVPVSRECVMWVTVGEKNFYDDSNGILRSSSMTHQMHVPMALLDEAKEYTICWRIVNERKPYFSDLSDVFSFTLPFRPVTGPDVRIYQVADAHNRIEAPVKAGSFFGDQLDLLLLNGDVPEDSGNVENFRTIHEIAGKITGGSVPVVFSRGNHDTRGIYAEKLPEYTACNKGVSYYTFRLGPLWGIVLDCGEDKADSSNEYGWTICCEDFRRRETEFLKQVAADPEHEYAAPGVKYRIVTSHVPFPQNMPKPFDIEEELYTEWCNILKETVKPDVIISGHMHQLYVIHEGDERDNKGTPCPVIVASKPTKDRSEFTGGAITLSEDQILVQYTNQEKQVVGEEILPRKK